MDYDYKYYKEKYFQAVHVSEFRLDRLESKTEELKVSQPLVGVILPVFNNSTFLKEAIESILNQTY